MSSLLPAISVATPIVILAVTLLTVLFAVAETFRLTPGQTSTLIVVSYGVSGLLSVAISAFYRQPMFMIWSSAGLIFMASLAGTFSYREMMGATLVAGLIVFTLGLSGLSSWLARVIPAPIVLGVLAGLVMPFVVRIFSDMQEHPLVIGSIVAVFIVSRRVLPARVPPILPALTVGIVATAAIGDLQPVPIDWSVPTIGTAWPTFSLQAILTVTPVLVVMMSVLANLSAVVMLRSQQFTPPARVIDVASGGFTMLSALFAPVPVTMGNYVTLLTAGPEAGVHRQRYWSVLATSGTLVLVAFTASLAVAIPRAVPLALLFGVAGLALFSVLSNALAEVTRGPLRIGPLFAFVVASSSLSLGGFGPAFWALVIGVSVSLLIESPQMTELRAAT
jgi:benzoate membrane transport protein